MRQIHRFRINMLNVIDEKIIEISGIVVGGYLQENLNGKLLILANIDEATENQPL
jgi:hypothetical protein